MRRETQKWYDKPVSKLILITIALSWMFPYIGFLISSFRPGESVKRSSWWISVSTVSYTHLTLPTILRV